MGCSVLQIARASAGIRVWFIVQNADGSLRTGLGAGDFTVTIIRDDDAATNSPAVAQSSQLSGVYFFDVPTAFLTTNGDQYAMVIQVTTTPLDAMLAPLFVTRELWDQLAGATFTEATDSLEAIRDRGDAAWITATGFAVPGDAMTLTAGERTTLAGVIDTTLSGTHGAGSWLTSSLSAAAVSAAVWAEPLPGLFAAGSAGFIVGTNLDVILSSKGAGAWDSVATGFAVPGDAMALTAAERTAVAGVVDTTLTASHGAGSWVGAGLTVTQDDRLRLIWKVLGLDPLNPTTHVSAEVATDGSITTPDSEIDIVVDQVSATVATFTQQ